MKPTPYSLTFLTLALFSVTILTTGSVDTATARAKSQRNGIKATSRQLDTCNSDSDCSGDRVCISAIGRCLDIQCNGVCAEEIICSCEDPCEDGQTCVETTEGSISFITCFPSTTVEELSTIAKPIVCETEDPVCIGIDMLQEFTSRQLVFRHHVLARVLCDPMGSCATKGHIVRYKGSSMMMVNYCIIVGCQESIMHVNSPRYQRGLKVKSRSEDMQFTAFAARYGTRTEEAVFAAAVRMGL